MTNNLRIQDLTAVKDARASFYGKAKLITKSNGIYLFSYDAIVAGKVGDDLILGRAWDCSLTTKRHIREFIWQMMGDELTTNEIKGKYLEDDYKLKELFFA